MNNHQTRRCCHRIGRYCLAQSERVHTTQNSIMFQATSCRTYIDLSTRPAGRKERGDDDAHDRAGPRWA